MSAPPVTIRPEAWEPDAALPPLGLVPAGSFTLEALLAAKAREALPVHLVFPVGRAWEAANLDRLLGMLAPLQGSLIDRIWLAFGGRRPGALARLPARHPGVELWVARNHWPADQNFPGTGKGAVMRAILYHLVSRVGVRHPRAVVQFLDADIRPAFFSPRWVIDPVGAVLRFRAVEAAKVVYHRPRGGRLNAILRALLAQCPEPRLQSLQKLVYLLSGEIAATLRFWAAVPFKGGYGVELLLLLSLACDRLRLTPGTPDLAHLVQVYVGRMDHRHAPVTSTRTRRGLDQMAGNIFHCLVAFLQEAGLVSWGSPAAVPDFRIPLPPRGELVPDWLTVSVGERTFPPLRSLPEIRALLAAGEAP